MSSVQVSKIDDATKNQLVLSYATLLLAASDKPVNEENLKKVIEASGCKPDHNLLQAFARILQGKDVKKFYACGGAQEEPEVVTKEVVKKEAPKAEVKEEKKEEEENFDMGDMFG